MELTHFSLFSGIGGFDLAAEWAGFTTIAQVEKNPYRLQVLRRHWPAIPLWEDIKDVTEESLQKAGIVSATLVTGGFPCQSFSIAGKRRGKADDRYLWPEMFRVVRLLRPHWVLAENVAGIIGMALDTVLSDLEGEDYSTQAFNIPACAVNAPHRRERIWIVAHYEGSRLRPQFNKITGKLLSENRPSQKSESSSGFIPDSQGWENDQRERDNLEEATGKGAGINTPFSSCSQDASDTDIPGFSDKEGGKDDARASRFGTPGLPGWWESEPNVGRVADGVPHRVDRLSALGDAIVPQVAYQILRAIVDIER